MSGRGRGSSRAAGTTVFLMCLLPLQVCFHLTVSRGFEAKSKTLSHVLNIKLGLRKSRSIWQEHIMLAQEMEELRRTLSAPSTQSPRLRNQFALPAFSAAMDCSIPPSPGQEALFRSRKNQENEVCENC